MERKFHLYPTHATLTCPDSIALLDPEQDEARCLQRASPIISTTAFGSDVPRAGVGPACRLQGLPGVREGGASPGRGSPGAGGWQSQERAHLGSRVDPVLLRVRWSSGQTGASPGPPLMNPTGGQHPVIVSVTQRGTEVSST